VAALDDHPLKVAEKDVLGLTGQGIAGSRIEAGGEGPAKVAATSRLSERWTGNVIIGNAD
jgi:hypothetical protein